MEDGSRSFDQSACVVTFPEPETRWIHREIEQSGPDTLQMLMETGKVTPVIDRRYKLSQVPEAIRYLEDGHARGKVVIAFDSSSG
jgi:NADPH:quinone reductase-like Zn-dependent oxidoreductase